MVVPIAEIMAVAVKDATRHISWKEVEINHVFLVNIGWQIASNARMVLMTGKYVLQESLICYETNMQSRYLII